MMNRRILTICATVAACAAGTSLAIAQQGYSAAPGSYSTAPAPNPRGDYPAGYRRVPGAMDAMPDSDAPDDEDSPRGQNSMALPPPGPAMSPDDPRYGRPVYSDRAVPQGPVMSPDDPRYGRPMGAPVYSDRAAQQGPVISPDDPRYGRPMGPPPVIYADRPAGAPPAYSDRGNPRSGFIDPDDNDGMRPPEGVGSRGAVTGSAQPPPQGPDGKPVVMSALPADEQPEAGPAELPAKLRRQEVALTTKEPPGTLIVDTPNTYLYYVLGNGRAIRYGVRVGRDGFTWTGTQKITRKAEWPDWHPPTEMIERQPYLPRFMAGGPGNPLGARAMYLGSTVYRIHGTNQPSTIGKFVSSGCIGMLNEDVSDLFDRVKVGTRVVVLPGGPAPTTTASAQPIPGPNAGPPLAQASGVPGTQPTTVPPLPAPVTIR
jgi:lipoprotein-anchoring transpeptidase ErfK/SrfK